MAIPSQQLLAAYGSIANRQTWSTWDGTYDGSLTTISSDTVRSYAACTLSSGTELVAFNDDTSSKYRALIVTTTGTTNSYGTIVDIAANGATKMVNVCALDSSRVLCVYTDASDIPQAVILSISGTTITVNTPVAINATAGNSVAVSFLSTDKSIVTTVSSSGTTLNSYIVTTSGTTVSSIGSVYAVTTGASSGGAPIVTLTSTTALVFWRDSTNTYPQVVVLSVSGTTISAPGSSVQLETKIASNLTIAALTSTTAIAAYANLTDSTGRACVMTISGTTITAGTPANFDTNDIRISANGSGLVGISATLAMIIYRDQVTLNVNGRVLTTSGTTFSSGTKVVIGSSKFTPCAGTLINASNILALYSGASGTTISGQVLSIT